MIGELQNKCSPLPKCFPVGIIWHPTAIPNMNTIEI